MSLEVSIYHKDSEESVWIANITHNLREMASHVPIDNNGTPTTLYYVCWRPEEIGIKTVGEVLPLLKQGLRYMFGNRKNLFQYESPNGWGTHKDFLRFLLTYYNACKEYEPECRIEANR